MCAVFFSIDALVTKVIEWPVQYSALEVFRDLQCAVSAPRVNDQDFVGDRLNGLQHFCKASLTVFGEYVAGEEGACHG